MLTFVTSLRHPQNSADYAFVEQLLHETLASVTAQVGAEFTVVVVGNRRPAVDLDPRVEFVEVDFPAPAPASGPRTARAPFVWDKGTKIGTGLLAAVKHAPTHVMIFDADDFVHRDLARFVAAHGPDQGWFVDRGWMYSRARGVYVEQQAFHRACGTSLVVPFGAYSVPADLDVGATQQEISDAFGERLPRVLGAHRDAVEWFSGHGVGMAPLPFEGAIYHVDTGENHSGKSLRGRAHPYDARMARDFSVPRTRSRSSAWWWSRGPRPFVESARRRIGADRDGRPAAARP